MLTCVESLVHIVQYAYELNFEDEPDYALLKHMFVKILLERDQIPDKNFDWTPKTVKFTSLLKSFRMNN